jgi:hypothetical protein
MYVGLGRVTFVSVALLALLLSWGIVYCSTMCHWAGGCLRGHFVIPHVKRICRSKETEWGSGTQDGAETFL